MIKLLNILTVYSGAKLVETTASLASKTVLIWLGMNLNWAWMADNSTLNQVYATLIQPYLLENGDGSGA